VKLRNAKIFEKIVPFVNLTIVASGGIYLLSFEKKKLKKTKKKIQYWCSRFPSSVIVFLSSLSVIDLEYRVIDETRFARLKNEKPERWNVDHLSGRHIFFPERMRRRRCHEKKKSRFSASCEAEEYCYFIIVYGGGKGVGYLYIYFSIILSLLRQ